MSFDDDLLIIFNKSNLGLWGTIKIIEYYTMRRAGTIIARVLIVTSLNNNWLWIILLGIAVKFG